MNVTYDAFAEWVESEPLIKSMLEQMPNRSGTLRMAWQAGYDKAKHDYTWTVDIVMQDSVAGHTVPFGESG